MWPRHLLALAFGVLAAVAGRAQESCDLGRGLVLLATAPPTDSVHVFNFVRSVEPEEYGGMYFDVGTDRTLLAYGQPAFLFTAAGVDAVPERPALMAGTVTFGGGEWLRPLLRESHDAALAFPWLDEAGAWVQAVTNDSTGEALWIKRGRHVAAYAWADLFASAEVVGRMERAYEEGASGPSYTQPLRSAPSDEAPGVEAAGTNDCFRVDEVRGAWLHVRAIEACPVLEPTTRGAWWVRWCRGDTLLAWPYPRGGFNGLIEAANEE